MEGKRESSTAVSHRYLSGLFLGLSFRLQLSICGEMDQENVTFFVGVAVGWGWRGNSFSKTHSAIQMEFRKIR